MNRIKSKYNNIKCSLKWVPLMLLVFHGLHSQTPDEKYRVLPDTIGIFFSGDMVHHYLQAQVDQAWELWKTDYEERKTPEAFQRHHDFLRNHFLEAIGGLPEHTPLHPRITGTKQCNGYYVEKIILESQPGHYVTGVLYLPDPRQFDPPYPGILIPCGHYRDSKAYDEYQSMGALCALNGMAAFIYDPIDQGERIQYLEPVGGTVYWGTRAHTMSGICAILLGWNIARFEIWDGMRAIDYLQSRPEIDPDRIGCSGNSGGGTQTAYLTALDQRIKAAAPSCYIHRIGLQTKKSMGDAEQNIFGQLMFGMDHPDYIMMRGPVPIKLLTATHDFFDINAVWETFRLAKRYYTRMGFSERMEILENDAGHNYNRTQREGAVRWLSRWLCGKDVPVEEPDLDLFSEEELNCTPAGKVMLMEGARSTYDLMADRTEELAGYRKRLWESENPSKICQQIRKLINCRQFHEIDYEVIFKEDYEKDGYQIMKLVICPEKGILLPALYISLKKMTGSVVLYLNENGKEAGMGPNGDIRNLLDSGYSVLAADIRGTGETRQIEQADMGKAFGYDWRDVFTAYLLGKSFVGMRTEDILACTKAAVDLSSGTVHLVAVGNVGVPALHAAALESGLFESVKVVHSLLSWSDVIEKRKTYNQLVNAVHGALAVYDLPDLVGLLKGRITIEQPLDSRGNPVLERMDIDSVPDTDPILPGLAGIWYGSENLVDPRDSDPVKFFDLNWEDPSKRGRGWSAEWFGSLIPPVNGKIHFIIESSHGGYLTIAGQQIAEWETGQAMCPGEIRLEKNKMVTIRIVYNHNGGETGYFRLYWEWAGQKKHMVPQTYLRHSHSENQKMRRIW